MWGGGKPEERPQAPAARAGAGVSPHLTVGAAPLALSSPPCHPPARRAAPAPAPLTKEARGRGEGRGAAAPAPQLLDSFLLSFAAGGAAAGSARLRTASSLPPWLPALPSSAVAAGGGRVPPSGRGVSQAALPGCATLTHSRAARRLRAAAAPAPLPAHASRASLRASGEAAAAAAAGEGGGGGGRGGTMGKSPQLRAVQPPAAAPLPPEAAARSSPAGGERRLAQLPHRPPSSSPCLRPGGGSGRQWGSAETPPPPPRPLRRKVSAAPALPPAGPACPLCPSLAAGWSVSLVVLPARHLWSWACIPVGLEER